MVLKGLTETGAGVQQAGRGLSFESLARSWHDCHDSDGKTLSSPETQGFVGSLLLFAIIHPDPEPSPELVIKNVDLFTVGTDDAIGF
jgi:hypothetical protein